MNKTVFIILRIEPDLKKKLIRQSKRERCSLSNLARRILLAALEANRENN
jgi:hypothetical protein